MNDIGYSSMVELMQDNFYERNQVFHVTQDAKASIEMNVLQMQVRQMSQERKKQ